MGPLSTLKWLTKSENDNEKYETFSTLKWPTKLYKDGSKYKMEPLSTLKVINKVSTREQQFEKV